MRWFLLDMDVVRMSNDCSESKDFTAVNLCIAQLVVLSRCLKPSSSWRIFNFLEVQQVPHVFTFNHNWTGSGITSYGITPYIHYTRMRTVTPSIPRYITLSIFYGSGRGDEVVYIRREVARCRGILNKASSRRAAPETCKRRATRYADPCKKKYLFLHRYHWLIILFRWFRNRWRG